MCVDVSTCDYMYLPTYLNLARSAYLPRLTTCTYLGKVLYMPELKHFLRPQSTSG